MINENWYQTAIEDYGIKEILYEELSEEKEKIGSGGFGKIYKTKCNSLGTVAIKEITIDIEVDIKRFIKELKLHSQIKHERIILFHGISRDEHKGHYLVLEYAKQGNLREFITKRFKEGEFKWAERKRLAIQIAEGLRYLHNEKNIIHRDLHTKNILIDDGNVKISDFGLSKNLDSTTISTDNRAFGVIPFVDPQKLNNKNFVLDKKSDIYSLGMVLWEISSCRTPFIREDYKLLSYRIICEGLRERPITGTPIEYKQIYVDCWELDPDSRPLVVEVLSRLESMSLEPVFEGDDEYPTYYPPSSPENTSGFNPSMASYIIPDGPTNPTTSSTNTVCNKCGKQLMNHDRCCECVLHALQEDFSNWTSEDEDLDKLIKVSQINAAVKNHDEYFEWIDYSQFKNKKWIIQGSYCDIYTATWTDGIRKRWDKQSQQWERTKDSQIILRKFRFKSTIKNLNLHLEIKSAIRCYGFTRDSKFYYMVLEYANGGNLRQYIRKIFPFSWTKRLTLLKKIVKSLSHIHEANYIHRDLYPGNILIQENNWEGSNLEVYISELDSCANLSTKIEQQQYGNLPYVAPEVILGNGNSTSIKSDIYSLGIIMWELASGDEPYSDYDEIDDKDKLIRDIKNEVRPNNIIGIPECYHELMQKCLDPDSKKRPTTQDLLDELENFTTTSLKKQFDNVDQELRDQPLGTRPKQLKDNNVITKSSINVKESYAGEIRFRFTNKQLKQLQFYNVPEP